MSKQELFIIFITISIWIASLRRPFYGISYFYFYFALTYNDIFHSVRFLRPLFVTPLIILISILFFQKRKLEFAPPFILVALFFLWMCLSRMTNGYNLWGVKETEHFFKIVIYLFLLTNVIDTKEKLKFFIWIMIIAYADLSFVGRYYDVAAPYFMNRNRFAFHLVGVIAFTAIFVLYEKGKLQKLEAVGYFMIILFGIAGSHSRGGYLAAGLVFVLLIVNNFNFKKLPLLIIPVIIILSRVSSVHWERLFSMTLDPEQSGTGGQRFALWSAGLRMILLNPIFGVGLGESDFQFSQYANLEELEKVGGNIGFEVIQIHNLTLQIGSEMGLVGLGLFLSIVLLGFRDIWQTVKICKQNEKIDYLKYLAYGIGISLAGLLTAGQFGNQGYTIMLYTTICLAYCIKKIVLRENESILKGVPVEDEPIIPAQWEIPFRSAVFIVFTYMSLRL